MKNIDFLKLNLIAHRGNHNSIVVENTIPSFIRCVDKKYIIELDIHILKDETIVIYHDFNLNRLCGVNKVIETLTYSDLSKIKIKGKYNIPTLEKVINIIDGAVPLIIEVKDTYNNILFFQKLVNILDKYCGKFAIQSMNPYVIDWFLRNRKDYIVGLIVYNKLNYKIVKKYIKKVDFISVSKKQLPIKINDKLILGWTIKTKEEYDKYINYCDNLICENIL